MTDTIKFLKYLRDAKSKDYQEVDSFLFTLGYKNFELKYGFLNEIQSKGYIRMYEMGGHPFAYHSIIDENGDPELIEERIKEDPKLMVRLEGAGVDYLYNESKITSSLNASWWAALGQWFAGSVAFLSVVVNLIQYYNAVRKDNSLRQQSEIIKQKKLDIDLLSKQNSTLLQFLDEKKPPVKHTSRPIIQHE